MQNYVLTSNKLLSDIVRALNNEKPNWDLIVHRFKQLPAAAYECDARKLAGLFSEIYVRTSLERICAEFSEKIIFDPITPDQTVGGFTARRTARGTVELTNGSRTYAEYDVLLIVDGLPVVFEITAHNYRTKQRLARKEISRKLTPLIAYFQTDRFGYVFTSLRSRGIVRNFHLRFADRGGTLAWLLYPDYRKELSEAINTLVGQAASKAQ